MRATPSGHQWVSCEVSSFVPEEGGEANRVVTTLRHVAAEGLVEQLLAGYEAVVNLRYSPDAAVDPSDFSARPLPFLIGGLRLTWPANGGAA